MMIRYIIRNFRRDTFESYPRHGPMKDYVGGFKERGKYIPEYHVHPSP